MKEDLYTVEEINWTLSRVGLAKYLRLKILDTLKEEKKNFTCNLSADEKIAEAYRRS